MRYLFAIPCLMFAVSTFSFAATQDDEVLAAERAWAAAVLALDFDRLENIYHDDLIYAHSSGVIEDKDQYLAKLRTGKQQYDAIIHHKSTVVRHGDAAVVHSIATMKGKNPVGPFDNKLMMIHTWFKGDDGWKLAAHQTTQIEK